MINNSSSSNGSTADALLPQCATHIEYGLVSTIAQASFVIFILILDVCGNCLVCGAILTYRRLRTVTNYFIISLAVSDLLVAALSMPFRIHHTLHDMCWDLGISTCEFWIFIDLLCSSASICNLSMIAVDRFLALSYPLTYPSIMTKRRGFLAIAMVWGYALLIAALSFALPWSEDGNIVDKPACNLKDKYYYTFAITVGFFLPLAILVIAYSLVFNVALRQARKLQILRSGGFDPVETSDVVNYNSAPRPSVISLGMKIERRRRKSIVRELKATKTLAIVVGSFIVCWMPFFIIMFIVQYCAECFVLNLPEEAQLAIGTVFVYVLPLLNSAVNPIIYSSFNANFRRAFRDILFRLCVLQRHGNFEATHRSVVDDDCTAAIAPNVHTTNTKPKYTSSAQIYYNGNTPKIVIHETLSENEEGDPEDI